MSPADTVAAFAPCRLGFAGGGTDLPAYAERFGGAVLSATLNLGARAEARPLDGRRVLVRLDDFGLVAEYGDVDALAADGRAETALVAALVAEARPRGGVALRVRTGLPPGSGLGASGAVGVAVTYALGRLAGRLPTPAEVAEAASAAEIGRLGRPIGRQDQYAAAFGGLNLFRFGSGGVRRGEILMRPAKWREFADHFMLFFSGRRRDSAEVLAGQRDRIAAGDEATLANLGRLKELAVAMADAARAGDWPLFGELLHRGWLAKTGVAANVADERAVRAVAGAREHGAWAMKVTGAGAGGFFFTMAPPARREDVAAFLAGEGFKRYEFYFDPRGVREVRALRRR